MGAWSPALIYRVDQSSLFSAVAHLVPSHQLYMCSHSNNSMLISRTLQCSAPAAAGCRSSSSECLVNAAASSPCRSRASSLQLHSYRPAAAVSSSSTSSNGRAAGLVCRDAPRPMWARKSPPPEAPKQTGSALAKLITRQISSAETVVQLSDVFNEWGGSFDYIHAAAALIKFAKLSRRGQGAQLLQLLVRKWLQVLPEAGARQCANILWACVNLSKQHQQQVDTVWEPTWAAFMQLVERDLKGQAGQGVVPQHLANAVYAAAQLRKQPAIAELQLLVQAFLRPDVLADAAAQATANLVSAISQLSQSRGWQGGVSEQDVQQLLGEQQLRVVADGTPQNVSNVLIALVRMATADLPLVERDFAQHCSRQLLSLVSISFRTWNAQDVTNMVWATGKLGLPADVFVVRAVQAAQVWVPSSIDANLKQAALACALLRYMDEGFLSLLLQRASVLLQQHQQPVKARSGSRVLSADDKASLAAILAASVAELDMQQLAGPARDLLASSGVGQQANTHEAVIWRLWVFHAWLLQHQLLDGRGLTGLVTEQQLRQGGKGAAAYGTGVTVAQL